MFLPSLSGITGLKLLLHKSSDYSLVNGTGDTLTETSTSGWFTATVGETWTETLSATVVDSDDLASAYGWLAVGATTVSDTNISGGDATLANQELILDRIDSITGEQLAAITVESGTIGNFPSTLTIGDSYDTDTGWIKIAITDENGDPITALGSLLFEDATVSFKAFRPNDSARISGVCEFVDGGTETYVKLTFTSAETTKGLPEYTYEGRLKFTWTTGTRQKTYKTTPFKFIANP